MVEFVNKIFSSFLDVRQQHASNVMGRTLWMDW